MTEWLYSDWVRDKQVTRSALFEIKCLFCSFPLNTLIDGNQTVKNALRVVDLVSNIERVCPICGWWLWYEKTDMMRPVLSWNFCYHHIEGAIGSLKEFDVSDQSVPIEAIRSYLAAKYDARFQVDPWRFEEVVASVYRDVGYQARVTARSGDGGIDVILDGPDNEVIGVQVKRYKDRIGVEQIRSFSGALFLEGMARGVFVTTSDFAQGAEKVAALSNARGIPIELVDSSRFFDVLGLAQRNAFLGKESRLADSRKLYRFVYSEVDG